MIPARAPARVPYLWVPPTCHVDVPVIEVIQLVNYIPIHVDI